MDSLTRGVYELRFKLEFLESKGEAFQGLFVNIMSKVHPGDFIPSRPWGRVGDRKNDGYLKSEATLFQVYAPNELKIRETLNKIDTDFKEALPHWMQYFTTWVFVHNSPAGLPPQVVAKLLELEQAHAPLKITHWGFQELLLRFRRLTPESLFHMYGPPSSVDLTSVKHNVISKPRFLGRQSYRRKVREGLRSEWHPVVISGSGGIGKTALALACAHELLEEAVFGAIVWVSAREREIAIEDVVDTVARTLGQSHMMPFLLEAKLDEITAILKSVPTLLVLDNYERVTDPRVEEFVRTVPPPTRVLITSRKRLRQFENARFIPLRPMPASEASQLVKNELARTAADIGPLPSRRIVDIVRTVGGIPLALKWAVGLAVEDGRSTSEVISIALSGQGDIFEALFGYAWQILSPQGHSALMSASIFPAPPDRDALGAAAGLPSGAIDEAISTLIELSLFEPVAAMTIGRTRFTMHPLALRFAHAKLGIQGAAHRAMIVRLADHYLTVSSGFPTSHDWSGQVLTADDDEMQIIIGLAHDLYRAGEWSRLIGLRRNVWYLLTIQGYWMQRIEIDELAVDAADRIGDRTVKPWVLVRTLSWIAFKEGRTADSKRFCEKGLELYEELGDEDAIAFCRVRLGIIALAEKEYSRAELLLSQALARGRAVGDDDLVLWSLGVLGELYCAVHEYGKGRLELMAGLQLAKTVGWPVRISLLQKWIAYSFLMEENLGEAEAYFEESLRTLRLSEGSHVDIQARATLGLAMVQLKQGATTRAATTFNEAKRLISGLQIKEEFILHIFAELEARFGDQPGTDE